MHQPEVPIDIIEIDVETLTLLWHQGQLFRLPLTADRKRPTRLDTTQNANQSLRDVVLFHDLTSKIFLGDSRRLNVSIRAIMAYSYGFRMSLDSGGKALCKRSEVLKQHPHAIQKDLQAINVADRPQRSPEQDSVKTCYTPDDAALVAPHKSLHGLPPALVFRKQPYNARTNHGALYTQHFGCGLGRAG